MFTIGEFSRLGQVSARMLRYYDQLGLLVPQEIGPENGYRYYSADQLPRLAQIERLKRYGFPLAEIGDLLTLSEETLRVRLSQRRITLCQQAARLHVLADELAYTLHAMETTAMKQIYEIRLQDYPAQEVYGVRRAIPCESHGIGQWIQEIYAQAVHRGLQPSGAVQIAFYGDGFDPECADMEVCIPVVQQAPDTHRLPGCLGVSTVHHGRFETLPDAYTAIAQWLDAHPAYHMDGAVSYERFLVSPRAAQDPEQMQTEIWFPVTFCES